MRIVLAIAAILLLSPASHATPTEQPSLLTLEQRWLVAAAHRDRATLEAILAEDFTDVSWRGMLRTRRDVLDAPAAPPGTHQALSGLQVRVYGDTAVVTGTNTVTAADASVVARLRFTDVFVKRAGRWQAVSAQETPVQAS